MVVIPGFHAKFKRKQIVVEILLVDIRQLAEDMVDGIHQRVEESRSRR